jgi:tRNA dimethylallyltransferase
MSEGLAPRGVFVVGATASGKTAFAHTLAEAFDCLQLVNLDAFQFYRGLDAGTAKPSVEERALFRYEMMDFLSLDARFDAALFAKWVSDLGTSLMRKGKIPLFVGGSGLYLRSVLEGLHELPPANADVRARLRSQAESRGWPSLHAQLQKCDPQRALALHPNDATRIERALEVFETSGIPMTQFLQDATLAAKPWRAHVVHVEAPVPTLKERIEQRARVMVGQSWAEEVRLIAERFGEECLSFQSFQAIGYKEVFHWLRKTGPFVPYHCDVFSGLREHIAVLTWQYARRQRTWNAKVQKDSVCISGENMSPATENVARFVDKGTK